VDVIENHPGLDRSCKFPDEVVESSEPLSVEENNTFPIRLWKAKEELQRALVGMVRRIWGIHNFRCTPSLNTLQEGIR
jgi:hypothetical protein